MNKRINYIFKVLVLFLFVLPSIIYGQGEDNFVMFGYSPQVVSHQLYKSLYKATKPIDKLVLLDSVATQFLRSNNSDSLFYYGREIKNEVLNLKDNQNLKKKFELKSLFYKGLGAQSMGFLDESIGYFLEGITLAENNDLMFQNFQLTLADTYILKRNKIKVKSILDELKPICNTKQMLFYYKLVSCNYYILNNEFSKAEDLINATIKEIDKEKYFKIYLRLKTALGRLKLLEGNFKESLSNFLDIKKQTLKGGYYGIYISIILNEGRIYSLSKNYKVAEIVLSTAYTNAVQ